jgi:predicted DCC family thiol-disulfide oxidoreductase YuxK
MAEKSKITKQESTQDMKLIVLYDGTCPFCSFSAQKLRKLDWFQKLDMVDLHSTDLLEYYKIPFEHALTRIQVVKNEKIREEGMKGILLISYYLPLLWLFIPIFWVSIKLGFGSKIYDWIAKNRLLFPVPGYCEIPEENKN